MPGQALNSAHPGDAAVGRCPLTPQATSGERKDHPMSDFDRNYATARGVGTDRAVAYDMGLRAHMLRVYNYMARASR
jgi:hypothetical protein